ncbi:SoxR reducing system RseC family protein [Algicola sagamiensis]|uniref:SoxR reducing system RseC family protein n=1 Tax=Algicola sagamiensis TaxID=163869 RepID=UPI00036513AE|nr:SoxR reducing system RseC family protein [Algicola sagamiensis]
MFEQVATVTRIHSPFVELEVQQATSCDGCASQEGCSTGVVNKALTKRLQRFQMKTDIQLSVGQQVKIGIQEKPLLKAALLVYILPLLLAIFMAGLAESIYINDIASVIGALAGGVIGFGLAKWQTRIDDRIGEDGIVILEIYPETIPVYAV